MFNISKDSHKALFEAEYAFICSGTATLEAALIGTPFTLSYIAKKLDFFRENICKIKLCWTCKYLFEKMGKEKLHSEFLQNEVTVENLLKDYESLNKEQFFINSKLLMRLFKTW